MSKLYLPKSATDASRTGINITYTKSTNTLNIGGWYDSIVGIESTRMTLGEFFKALNIPKKNIIIK